jgi:hypothetical protein
MRPKREPLRPDRNSSRTLAANAPRKLVFDRSEKGAVPSSHREQNEMRRSTVCWATFLAVAGGMSFAACSSDGGDEKLVVETDAGADASAPADANAPADTGAADTGAADSGAVDAGSDAAPADAATDASLTDATVPADGGLGDATVPDAARDAATDAALDAGLTCVSTAPLARKCGFCGTQSASCTANDAGGFDQGAYGSCTGEIDGGCAPGSEADGGIACGRCGRARRVCQSDCFWAQGSCVEPANAVCNPGERSFRLGLSCPNANEGRYATCGNDCTLSYGDCTVEETWVNVSSTVNVTATRPFTMKSTPTTGRGATSGTNCTPTSTATPYDLTVIRNPTGKALKIAVWQSFAPNGPSSLDTIMNVFQGEGLPANRSSCLGANDTCSASPCVGSGLAGLVGTSAITIGVGESLTVYNACYSSSCSVPAALVLNVRTLEILP